MACMQAALCSSVGVLQAGGERRPVPPHPALPCILAPALQLHPSQSAAQQSTPCCGRRAIGSTCAPRTRAGAWIISWCVGCLLPAAQRPQRLPVHAVFAGRAHSEPKSRPPTIFAPIQPTFPVHTLARQVSESLWDRVHECYHVPEQMGSDHCPLVLVMKPGAAA